MKYRPPFHCPHLPVFLGRFPSRERKSGFTLTELLVVIVIIAALAAIVLAVTTKLRQSARTAQATTNIRQIGVLLSSYIQDNNNRLPVSINWGNIDNTWLQRVLSESAGLPVKPAKDLERRLADIFYDPALGNKSHPYGDFGVNDAILTDFKPWLPGSDPNTRGRPLDSIGALNKKVLVASAKILSGVPCKGSWAFQGSEWAAAGTAATMPDARHGGKTLSLFADGHVKLLNTDAMDAATRKLYFLPDINGQN